MPDLEAVLKQSPLTQAQRADVWDAYHSAGNEDDLAKTLTSMQVPKEVKAKLWDLKSEESNPAPKVEPPKGPTAGMDMSRFEYPMIERTPGAAGSALAALGATAGAIPIATASGVPAALGAAARLAAPMAVGATGHYLNLPPWMTNTAATVTALATGAPRSLADLVTKGWRGLAPAAEREALQAVPAAEASQADLLATLRNAPRAGEGVMNPSPEMVARRMIPNVPGGAAAAETAAPAAAAVAKASGNVGVASNAPTSPGKLIAFARKEAADTKLGQKIFMEVDDSGNPTRLLKEAQVGPVEKAGGSTSWVRNYWSR